VSAYDYGASLSTEARINKVLSAYAEGYVKRDTERTDYGAAAGLRARW
jgi:hypothetical protein